MALPVTLADIGYYLLWAIGLILLFILFFSAMALLLTRIDIFAKQKVSSGVFQKKISLSTRLLFLRYAYLAADDFEAADSKAADSETDNSKANDSEADDFKAADFENAGRFKQMFAPQESESKTVGVIEKNACYVTKTGEEIKIRTIQYQKYWDVYDVVIEVSDKKETSIPNEEDEISISTEEDEIPASIEEDEPSIPTGEDIESDKKTDSCDIKSADTKSDDTKSNDTESEDTDSEDIESELGKLFHDLGDLSDDYDDIQKYVDLSNPAQFISDSLTAAAKISISGSHLIGALLLRTNIKKLSLHLDYGLSNPAGTAVSYGALQSFISGIYAYLDAAAKRSRSSHKKRRCREIAVQIQNNVLITPKLMEKKIDLESEISVSFWIVRSYIPLIRFLISKNTRWVLRRYVWVYCIKHYLKNQIQCRQHHDLKRFLHLKSSFDIHILYKRNLQLVA